MNLCIVLMVCALNLGLGVFVFMQNVKSKPNRLFALMSISLCVWILLNYLTDDTIQDFTIGSIANILVFASSFASIIFTLLFTYFFPVKRLVGRAEITSIGLISVLVMCLTFTPMISGTVTRDIYGELAFSVGSYYWILLAAMGAALLLIIRNLLSALKKADKKVKMQTKLILVGFSVTMLIGLICNIVIPTITNDWTTAQFGTLGTIVLVLMIVYAMTRYSLFDVRLAAVRTGAYVLSLLTLSVAYYCLAYLVSIVLFNGEYSSSVSISPINIILALLLAFVFQPIKQFFDKVTNGIFYKDRYSSDEFFASINKTLTSTTELRGLLARSANEIGDTLKSEQAFFFVNTFNDHYITAGTHRHKMLPREDAISLSTAYDTKHEIILASLLDADDPVRRLMVSHQIEVVLPLVKSEVIIGYLCLGEHQTSGYTSRDIKVLETISDGLIIAIQNALSIEEVRELNSTLQQRVEEATKELRASNAQLQRLDKVKDEFVSIASHQLRTPLTSVKGYISMVLEGDAGEINDNQRKLLDEAFNSSERMVHLIGDFLNVSRLQTGKFVIDKNPADLSKIVQEEVDGLQPSAISRNMKLVYKFPKNFPIIELDEGKFRQVIMNFADNAIYYSREGSTIEINLSVENNEAIYTVKDTGIGVPENEREQLFTKFYRASNAKRQRPDGTGVGLFLAKKIVDSHGGRIIFESVEGKGSTFGFRLPIK